MRVVPALCAVVLAVAVMAGCSSDDPDDQAQDAPTTSTTGAGPTTTEAPPAADPGTPGAVPEAVRDGVWPVGEAGEVEFELAGDALRLVEVRPADGWEHRVNDEQPDEIKVHFTRGGERWKSEVELDPGRMEIQLQQEIDAAEPGTYHAGAAGTLTFSLDGARLAVTGVAPADGWSVTKRDEQPDEFEVELRRDRDRAEFEGDLRDGRVELEISYKLEGPTSPEGRTPATRRPGGVGHGGAGDRNH